MSRISSRLKEILLESNKIDEKSINYQDTRGLMKRFDFVDV